MDTRRIACTAALAALIMASSARAQAQGLPEAPLGPVQPQGAIINVDVENVPLEDVMEQIGRQVGKNILVDPNVHEVVTVSLREIPWREAVDVIARMRNCEVEERSGGILVLTQPPKVTIQFTDANVRTVLQLLAAYSGKNIIISDQVRGTVTLDLKEVHWLRALHAIVKTVGDYEVVEEDNDLLRVVTRSSIEQQLETVVYPLRYVRPPAVYRAVPPRTSSGGGGSQNAPAAVYIGPRTTPLTPDQLDPNQTFTLLRALQTVVSSSAIRGATLQYDAQTNSFIVTATRPLLNQLKAIIDKVDIQPAQIYAEVKFVATKDNNFTRYGIEFSPGRTDQGLGIRGPFEQFVRVNGNPVGEYPFLFGQGMDAFTEPFNVPGVLNLQQLDMVLQMLDRDDRSRVIQSPSLFMLDNQDAVIFVGENVPYVEFQSRADASGNVTVTVQEAANSPVSVGFSLFLQPHVIPDADRIHLTVIPRVNNLIGTSSTLVGFERFTFLGGDTPAFIDLPRTQEQALVTHVLLEDTNTAVLGGLLTEQDIEINKKVPILSSIPIIGNLFQAKQLTRRLENLSVFITPTIIRDRQTTNSIFHRTSRRLEETDYFYRRYELPEDEDGNLDYQDDR